MKCAWNDTIICLKRWFRQVFPSLVRLSHKFMACFGRHLTYQKECLPEDEILEHLCRWLFPLMLLQKKLLVQFNTQCSLVISNISHSVCTELCDRHNPVTKRTVPLSNPTKRQSFARTNALRSERTEACSCWLKRLRQKYSSFSVGEILRC